MIPIRALPILDLLVTEASLGQSVKNDKADKLKL